MAKPRDLANSVNAASIPGTRLVNDAITASKMAPDSVDSSELAHGAVTTSKVHAGAITNAKLAFDGGALSGFRNLIINGNPVINQRVYVSGTNTTGANQYTLDRWRVVTSGQSLTFTTTAGLCTATAPAGGVEQVIEGASILGGTYVLNWEGTATATINGNAVAKGGSVTLTGDSDATVRMIEGTFTKVQLEPGSHATVFEQRPYAVEYALCQRYYETGTAGQSVNNAAAAATVSHTVYFRVTKRAAPVCTIDLGATQVANSNALTTYQGSIAAGAWYNPGNYTASAEL